MRRVILPYVRRGPHGGKTCRDAAEIARETVVKPQRSHKVRDMPNRQERLRAALTAAFDPVQLHVQDDSALHAGHAGASAAGETHYTIRMVSAAFAGQGRVARSRAVHTALAIEFERGLHALSLSLAAPGESAPANSPIKV